ncbi:hypothetical protein GDO81_029720 [Engystomops pustulosus]|uniref:C2H2-type domain-containing protein n=1 Tax=Engystomops pustulosus TaxID=76066 RepID=A0AAV6Z5D5_ENGPU|nr:hypothetical protein GDO81_029720 [Engystomops pustulosus]
MDNVSRVNSPITSDRITEELTMDGVTGEHGQITSVSRPHEPLTVDANLPPDAVGHAGVLPLHSGSLELPVVMETDHHMGGRSGMSENSLTDAIHTVALSSNPVSVSLSTSHQLSSLTAVSLHAGGISLEPVTVSSITADVSLPGGHVDAANLTFVPTSLQIDSNSNKENMAALFTIWCTLCNRAYPSDCPEHGPVTFIPDNPIESRARLSLPKQLVLRQSLTGADVGVWTQESISVRTCFGPLIGQESQSLEVAGWTDKSANHIWKIYSNNVMEFCIITTDENECNWMMFVRKARERQIKCPKCDKHFSRTNHLKKHLNSHLGKRDYVCEKCSKAFLTKYHLTRHLKICKGPSTAPLTDQEEDDSEEEEEILSSDCNVFTADAQIPSHT